jgi:hypothetical protein
MWRAMLARLPRRTTMAESEHLAESLLSERRGPSGGLRLRSHQKREWDAQGAMLWLFEGKASTTCQACQVLKLEA